MASMSIAEALGGKNVQQALIAASGHEPFHLGPLPYAYDALEPVIDRETLKWHHDVHHRCYVDRLNEALASTSVRGRTLEEILSHVSAFPQAVRDHGGGHWNHTFFWSVMTDCKEDQEISPELLKAFEKSFGSLDAFKAEFVRVGSQHVGSGWLWLIKDGPERLHLATTLNHDNPLMDVCAVRGQPILVCDLWEHAYYLHFKAKREDFLRQFFALVNWTRVHKLLIGDYH